MRRTEPMPRLIPALILLVTFAAPADACHARRRCHRRAAAPCRPAQAVYAAPQGVYAPPVYNPPPAAYGTPQTSTGGYGAALAVINAARARHGRGALGWADDLAAFAAVNRGVHGVMAPGAAQVQAWCGSPTEAAYQWLSSPQHLAILVAATHSIGISQSAGSWTANVR